jgi:hypothetical protein
MNVRIQTYSKDTCESLLSNFDNISTICDIISNKFDSAILNYNKSLNKKK